jgi:hypothetical protein
MKVVKQAPIRPHGWQWANLPSTIHIKKAAKRFSMPVHDVGGTNLPFTLCIMNVCSHLLSSFMIWNLTLSHLLSTVMIEVANLNGFSIQCLRTVKLYINISVQLILFCKLL